MMTATDNRELRERAYSVKDWLNSIGITYYSQFLTGYFPDFKDYTKLRNVMNGRTADKKIVEMMEAAVKMKKEQVEEMSKRINNQ